MEFTTFENFGVREDTSHENELMTVNADVFIVPSCWEKRGWQFTKHLTLDGGKMLIMDFEIDPQADPEASAMVEMSKVIISDYANACDQVSTKIVPFLRSINARENINRLGVAIDACVNSGARKLFVDISSLPRIYIQEMIGLCFRKKNIPFVQFGYAIGKYGNEDGVLKASHGFAGYVNIPSLSVTDAMSRKKILVASIGVENELLFRLAEDTAPNIVRIIYAPSDNEPLINTALEAQIKKAQEMLDVDSVELFRCEPFDIANILKVLRGATAESSKEANITIFVAGPKPHAIGAALLGCTKRNVALRARVPPRYGTHAVEPRGIYKLISVIDLSSPMLSSIDF